MTIAMRAARVEDLDRLDDLHTRCMREHVERHHPWRPDQFRATFNPLVNHVIIADGEEVGLLSRWEEPDAIRIGNLLIEPARQGAGIGTAVLRDILAKASSRGVAVRLRVLDGNPAQKLYERLGFVLEEELESACMMIARPSSHDT
jgi:ribosomal protein S18 acetylase RimI-like enzyme